MVDRADRAAITRANESPVAPRLRRADDGLDRPSLPVLPAPHRAPRAALHRDDHERRAGARRRPASPRFRSRRASAGAAAGRQRSRSARRRREAGRALGLRRDQPQLRLPVRARADGQLRRLPDGGAGARRRLRQGDARCGFDSGDGQAPDRARPRRRLRFRPRLRRHRRGRRLRGLHRPCAQRRAEGTFAEGESRSSAAALRRRAPAEARFSGADDRPERRARRLGRHRARARARGRRDARPRRVSRPVLPGAGGLARIRRRHAGALARRGAAGTAALCADAARARRAAARHRAARARALSRPVGRAALPADPVRRGETEGRAAGTLSRGAGGGGAGGARATWRSRSLSPSACRPRCTRGRWHRNPYRPACRAPARASARSSPATSRRCGRSPGRTAT